MPLLIASLKVVNTTTAVEYDFVPNAHQRVTKFVGTLPRRGDDTNRMGMHGRNPRRPVWGGLQIAQEGLFLAPADEFDLEASGAALVAERDAMVAAIFGDLTVPPTDPNQVVLTVQMAGWTETASAPASLASWDVTLDSTSVRTAPYMLGWSLETPYLIGDTSATQKLV